MRAGSPVSSHRASDDAVFLIGFMGAGKSSVGQALSKRLSWTFEDLDERVERRERRSVAQIFRESGEPAFRRAENSALQELLDGMHMQPRVVALGGGACVQASNAALLKASGMPIVFLDAAVDELWQRCCRQSAETGSERPLLISREQFRNLYDSRRPHYSQASLTVQTGGRTVEDVADEIVQKLELKNRPGKPNKEKSSEVPE